MEAWVTEEDEGVILHGIAHSEAGAMKIFNAHIEQAREEAQENGYTIYEESSDCFDAGLDGEYKDGHLKLFVAKTSCVE